MNLKQALGAVAVLALASTAQAAGFVNGGFETGDTTGWIEGDGYRGNVLNNALVPTDFLPGGSKYISTRNDSQVISSSYVDPMVGALLGSTVHSGSYALRAQDTNTGGYASVITQTVNGYTDPNIYFAWKAVLQGAHGINDAATVQVRLIDLSDNNNVLVNRAYNAASGGGGVDSIFSSSGGFFYTPQWQTEQIAIDASLSGHNFQLLVLAADCQPTGHRGYAYLDGFGAAPPANDVPEPASLALVGLALAGAAASRRRAAKA